MSEFPDPLTPPECDLRGMEWMPLDINRLLTSETWILGTAEECKAAVTLWCEAWRQVPSASLPDDDRMLAHLSRLGPAWKRARDAVLRSWVKCSDGRIYHPVVAEKARSAWEAKLAQAERTRAATEARKRKRDTVTTNEAPPTMQRDGSATTDATNNETINVASTSRSTLRSPEEKRGEEKKERTYPSDTARADAAPRDARSQLWTDGLVMLRGLTGKADGASRAFLGRLLRDMRDDCAACLAVLDEAADLKPGLPEAWLIAAARSRASPSAPPAQTHRQAERDHNQREIERLQRELTGQPEPDFFAGTTIEGTIQ